MAVLRIPDEKRTLREENEIREHLASIGIEYERWPIASGVAEDAPAEQVLQAYAPQVEQLKQRGGYATAGATDRNPNNPGARTYPPKFYTRPLRDADQRPHILPGLGLVTS